MQKRKRLFWPAAIGIIVAGLYYSALPVQLFRTPYSYVLEDRDGNLLSATVAADGQWRFPLIQHVPEKFAKAIVLYEDKRFYQHFGVDVLALARAIRQNLKAGKVVSGGSTLTMQVIRLSRKESRTYLEKIIELILATRLEFAYSKDEILNLYASHAPFGGNVVGIEAAAWRYFGRSPEQLSWAEAATLAVLPNAPSLIHPGKNRDALLKKRNSLLVRLHASGYMDDLELQLALEETLPEKPVDLPQVARHLLDRSRAENPEVYRIRSTLNESLQRRTEQIAYDHARRLQANKIYNVAVLVAEAVSGEVLAYVGNAVAEDSDEHGRLVDIVRSPRSTGSILKPFLFAAMLDEGKILPKTLLPDIPVMINGFAPKNFSLSYDGAVPADEALVRSLNIPAVHMLREYRYEKFHDLLKRLGMTTLSQPPDHYGLSLIVGGAEGTLWDITAMYASMARVLNKALSLTPDKRYNASDYHPLNYLKASAKQEDKYNESSGYLSAASIYQTFEALTELNRPGEEHGWKTFSGARKIAWKTGTSFGFRDGWAIGVTPRYVVGVWAGNAGGEGRPGLTGVEAAAPVLFDVFNTLPVSPWFAVPYSELQQIAVCKLSGMRLSDACSYADTLWVGRRGLETQACLYHKWVHLSKDLKYRVHMGCADATDMVTAPWFVLPPVQEYYYARRKMFHRALPPFLPSCQPEQGIALMDWVYPKEGSKIFIPRQLSGEPGRAVFELSHRQKEAVIYWHLDGEFYGITTKTHQISVNPGPGSHFLQVFDHQGQELKCRFTVISSN